ncbi:hypothetical protein ROZALSC1DRAFT_30698, partial [Rozella allomycis CSF55]
MYIDVENYIKSCIECQLFSKRRLEEPLNPNLFNTGVLHTVHVDLVKMPKGKNGENYFCSY